MLRTDSHTERLAKAGEQMDLLIMGKMMLDMRFFNKLSDNLLTQQSLHNIATPMSSNIQGTQFALKTFNQIDVHRSRFGGK